MKGWRTIIFNAAMAVAVVLVEVTTFMMGFPWGTVFSPAVAPWILIGSNIANIVLRSITTTPVGKG